jgi:hypothetical protein
MEEPEFHNHTLVGLAIALTADLLRPCCTRYGRMFYKELIMDWKRVPLTRSEPEWTDQDLPMIKCTMNGTPAGTKYGDAGICHVCHKTRKKGDPACTDVSKHASQQRKDFASAIKQHHINSSKNIEGTPVEANRAATNQNIRYAHCDASRWGDGDAAAWFEVFKAYIQMHIGSHDDCIQKTHPEHLDICALTAGMTFCDGYKGQMDQRTSALPERHPLRVEGSTECPSGTLELARNVRNTTWGHAPEHRLSDKAASQAIRVLLKCAEEVATVPAEGQGAEGEGPCEHSESNIVDRLGQLIHRVGKPSMLCCVEECQEVLKEIRRAQHAEDHEALNCLEKSIERRIVNLEEYLKLQEEQLVALQDPASCDGLPGEPPARIQKLKETPNTTDPGVSHSGIALWWCNKRLEVAVHRIWFSDNGTAATKVMLRGSSCDWFPPEWQRGKQTLDLVKSLDVVRFGNRDLITWSEDGVRRGPISFPIEDGKGSTQIGSFFEDYFDTAPECRQQNCQIIAEIYLSMPELRLEWSDPPGGEIDKGGAQLRGLILERQPENVSKESHETWLHRSWERSGGKTSKHFPKSPWHEVEMAKTLPQGAPPRPTNIKNRGCWWVRWRKGIERASLCDKADLE